MNGPPADSSETRRLAFEASEWIIRLDRGLTAPEQDAFSQWLATDPRHGEWLARRRQVWKELDILTEWRPRHSAEPNPDLLARPRRRSWWGISITLMAAASVAFLFAVWRPWRVGGAGSASVATVAPVYECRQLDDGSTVELNRGAAIAVAYMPGERRVALLRGEAHFSVAKNPQRPFVVRAGGIDVRAVGTAFAVRLGSETIAVLVTEGRVRVDAAFPHGSTPMVPVLLAGQQAVLSEAGVAPPQITNLSAAEVGRLLDWRPKLLDFDATPLAEVVAEFNRQNRVQLVIADPSLATMPIVASFRSNNPEGFVRLLELTGGVHAERRGDAILLHRAH